MTNASIGFLNINKPQGLTSHDVVARIRRKYKESTGSKKVGHAGTLDPMATGVLVLCLGSATRLSEYVMQSTKSYRAVVHLGISTDTYDAEGTIVQERDADAVTLTELQDALQQFTGDIEQIPPMYSAIKQGGRKLYELARQGKTVSRPPRPVSIHSLEIADWSPPQFTLEVVCGAGTYIRSLAYDLGETLGVGAHLAALTRTASGAFQLEDAYSLDDLLEQDDWDESIISPREALPNWQVIQLTAPEVEYVRHGRSIPCEETNDTLALGYTTHGHLLALLRVQDHQWKAHKVFPLPD